MKKSTLITIALLLLILVVVGFFTYTSIINNRADVVEESAAAAVFNSASSTGIFTDYNGNPAHLEQHLDSVIVAHAWASWVPTSPQSLVDLATIQAEFSEADVTVLAINRGERYRTAQQFLKQVGVTNLKVIADGGDLYFKTVGGNTMPETIFYDRKGNVVFHKRGVISIDELRLRTQEAIRESEEK